MKRRRTKTLLFVGRCQTGRAEVGVDRCIEFHQKAGGGCKHCTTSDQHIHLPQRGVAHGRVSDKLLLGCKKRRGYAQPGTDQIHSPSKRTACLQQRSERLAGRGSSTQSDWYRLFPFDSQLSISNGRHGGHLHPI